MGKKKFSGQTIAIIILAILLLLTLCFGGVFAYYTYSSSKVTGQIMMANLSIELETNNSTDKSVISISNQGRIVPGEKLQNSKLMINNTSSVGVYIIIVYEMKAVKKNGDEVQDKFTHSMLGLGWDYINPTNPSYSENYTDNDDAWVDYVFYAEQEDKYYRCMVNTVGFESAGSKVQQNTVIEENQLALSKWVNNDYMGTTISFVMQAYAIGTASFMDINQDTPIEEKCSKIISAIYLNEGYEFFNVTMK